MAALFKRERAELLEGIIMTMSPQNSSHAATVHRLLFGFLPLLGPTAYVRIQAPLILDEWGEPDIAVCRPDPMTMPASTFGHAKFCQSVKLQTSPSPPTAPRRHRRMLLAASRSTGS